MDRPPRRAQAPEVRSSEGLAVILASHSSGVQSEREQNEPIAEYDGCHCQSQQECFGGPEYAAGAVDWTTREVDVGRACCEVCEAEGVVNSRRIQPTKPEQLTEACQQKDDGEEQQ